MTDLLKPGSIFDQIDDFERDRELVGPILKEVREDRATIKGLVEAGNALLEAIENGDKLDVWCAAMRAAIRKAEGPQQ